MEYGYFPGCSMHGTAKEFDTSIRESLEGIGVTLREVPDWNCCGASSGHVTSEELALSLSARVLGQAEAAGLMNVVAPCAACYSRLKTANVEMAHDPGLQKRANQMTGGEYKGGVKVLHLTEVYKQHKEDLAASITKPLKGFKIVSYYGCLLARPRSVVDFDDVEDPTTMDILVATLGAQPLEWSHKTECCGAGFSFSRTDIATRLVGEILDAAKMAGADAITVACPLCHANLDMRQAAAAKRNKTQYGIAVLYLSQLVGLAQGNSALELGLDKHIVSASRLLGMLNAVRLKVPEVEPAAA